MPDSALRMILADCLGECGFRVVAVSQPTEALSRLREERWGGVVIDWQMGSAIRWVGEAVARRCPQARLVVMLPQGARLRWSLPQLETVVHPFRPSLLARKLGGWSDASRLGDWFQRASGANAGYSSPNRRSASQAKPAANTHMVRPSPRSSHT